MEQGSRVIPGVQVLRVEQDGPVLTADVFGGEEAVVVGEVEFRIDDPAEHERVFRTFKEWEDKSSVLTLVEGEDGVVTLLDEATAFGSAMEGPPAS